MNTDPIPTNVSPTNSLQQRRDIVDTLKAAGVAPQKLMELDKGRALAHWQNRKEKCVTSDHATTH